jgi:glycine cleavage system H protein
MATYPENYRYTKEHEWVSLADGNLGTVGITELAQQELGDIVFVDLPASGTVFAKGKAFGTVESVKAVSEVYLPVSGEILEVNPLLATSPETVNQDPNGAGWLVKVRLSNPEEIKNLLTAAEYQSYIGDKA